ncbi:MAG TPA: cytochrome c1 [Alphaproteobacteria bacterium]|nr:cytochrome c1 [Alphaproteobacteria bacterium]
MKRPTVRFSAFFTVFLFATGIGVASVRAAESAQPPAQNWPFSGLFGTYDRASLQRGYQVYREVCSACHAMKRVRYRELADLGYSEAQIKAVAAQYSVMDGPNDEGEMFERPARPSDPFKSPFANDQAARAANGGALPPDLSLIVKARPGGANYVYALLTGFEDPPAGHTLLPGQNWNAYMAGNVIAMAPPLTDGQVAYADGSAQTVSQYARDVAQFLTWASDPTLEERKETGFKALLFLFVFVGVFYAAKRKIWSSIH